MFKGKKVILVDDDHHFQNQVATFLAEKGFFVYPKSNLKDFSECLNNHSPDIALIDKNIGFEDGFDLIHEVRRHPTLSTMPIIVVTGSPTMDNKTEAIRIGADDLIAKPLDLEDLELRIIANLRRSQSYYVSGHRLDFNGIELDLKNHTLHLGGVATELTKTEYKILLELVSKKGEIVNRDQIAHRFLSFNNSSVRTLDVHINSLRKKLGERGPCIKTIRGRGYMFQL